VHQLHFAVKLLTQLCDVEDNSRREKLSKKLHHLVMLIPRLSNLSYPQFMTALNAPFRKATWEKSLGDLVHSLISTAASEFRDIRRPDRFAGESYVAVNLATLPQKEKLLPELFSPLIVSRYSTLAGRLPHHAELFWCGPHVSPRDFDAFLDRVSAAHGDYRFLHFTIIDVEQLPHSLGAKLLAWQTRRSQIRDAKVASVDFVYRTSQAVRSISWMPCENVTMHPCENSAEIKRSKSSLRATLECVVSAPGDGKTFFIRRKLRKLRNEISTRPNVPANVNAIELASNAVFELRVDESFTTAGAMDRLESAFSSAAALGGGRTCDVTMALNVSPYAPWNVLNKFLFDILVTGIVVDTLTERVFSIPSSLQGSSEKLCILLEVPGAIEVEESRRQRGYLGKQTDMDEVYLKSYILKRFGDGARWGCLELLSMSKFAEITIITSDVPFDFSDNKELENVLRLLKAYHHRLPDSLQRPRVSRESTSKQPQDGYPPRKLLDLMCKDEEFKQAQATFNIDFKDVENNGGVTFKNWPLPTTDHERKEILNTAFSIVRKLPDAPNLSRKMILRNFLHYLVKRCKFRDANESIRFMETYAYVGSILMESAIRESGLLSKQLTWREHPHCFLVYDDPSIFLITMDEQRALKLSDNTFRQGKLQHQSVWDKKLDIQVFDFKNKNFTNKRELCNLLAVGLGISKELCGEILFRNQYVLTLDFVIKFLHLEERRNARTATILQGETGVGKTFLLHVYAQLVSQLVVPQEKKEPDLFVQLHKIMDDFHKPVEKQANVAHHENVLARQAAPAEYLDSFSEKYQEHEEKSNVVKQQIELAKSFAPLSREVAQKLDSRHSLDTLGDLIKITGRLGRALAQACRVPLQGLSLFPGLAPQLGEALLSSLRDWVNKVCNRAVIDRALFIYLERHLRENDDVDVTLLARFWSEMADLKRAEYLDDGDVRWQQYIASLLNVTVAKLGVCEFKAPEPAAGTSTPDFKTVRDFCSVPLGYVAFKAFFAVVQAAIFSVKRSSFFHLDVHGGLQFSELQLFIRYVSSYALRNPSVNITAFLDEVNTASILGSFQEIMVDRSLEGKALPENIFWVGAINPPRTDSSVSKSEDPDQGRRAVLDMYNVRPLPEGWLQMVWDYGALDEEQEKDYVNAKLELWSANLRREMAHEYIQEANRYTKTNICQVCATPGHWTRNCPRSTADEKEADPNMSNAEHALLSALHILPGSKSRFDRARREERRQLTQEDREEMKMFDPDKSLHQELDDKLLNEYFKKSSDVVWSLQSDEHKHERKHSSSGPQRESRSLSNVHKLLIGIDGAVASLANLVVEAQKFVRDCHGVSAVSQRDIQRVFKLLDFFLKDHRKRPEFDELEPNQLATRCMFLAIGVSYYLRLEDTLVQNRTLQHFVCDVCTFEHSGPPSYDRCEGCEQKSSFTVKAQEEKVTRQPRHEFCALMAGLRKGALVSDTTKRPWSKFAEVMGDEMKEYIKHAKVPVGIARNQALKENFFAIAVCTENKISLCLLGPPGCSKTLSFSIATDTMRGQPQKSGREAKVGDQFFYRFSCIYGWDVTYQCSENSTDKEIKEVFIKQIERQQEIAKGGRNATATVFLDEASLPRQSKDGKEPLKVLHYFTDNAKVAVVICTNRSMDAAKSNRTIRVFRPPATLADLVELAYGCLELDESNISPLLKSTISGLCHGYDSIKNNPRFKEQFQQRDFCQFLRYFLRHNSAKSNDELQIVPKDVLYSLERNFGGISPEDFLVVAQTMFAKAQEALDSIDGVNFHLPLWYDRAGGCWTHDRKLNERKLNDRKITDKKVSSKVDVENGLVPSKPDLFRSPLDVLESSLTETPTRTGNLNDNAVRFKLIIDPSDDESAARLLVSLGLLPPKTRVIQLSDFPADNTDLVRSECVADVKDSMAAGHTVFLMHTDQIHGSFYDLFNQRFKTNQNQHGQTQFFVNLAIGAFSKACQVNDNPPFRCLVHLPKHLWKPSSLAFKSRFEKYIISIDTVMRDFHLSRLGEGRRIAELAFKSCQRFVSYIGMSNFFGYACSSDQESMEAKNELGVGSPTLSSLFVSLMEAIATLNLTLNEADLQPIIRYVNLKLLQLLRPEAFILKNGALPPEYLSLYLDHQEHFSLRSFLQKNVFHVVNQQNLFLHDPIETEFLRIRDPQGNDSAPRAQAQRKRSGFLKHMVYLRNSSLLEQLQQLPSTYISRVGGHRDLLNEEQSHILVRVLGCDLKRVALLVMSEVESMHMCTTAIKGFVSDAFRQLCVIVVNTASASKRQINLCRQFIDEHDYQGSCRAAKAFVFLMLFPAEASQYQSCYSAIFLSGWDHSYLDASGEESGGSYRFLRTWLTPANEAKSDTPIEVKNYQENIFPNQGLKRTAFGEHRDYVLRYIVQHLRFEFSIHDSCQGLDNFSTCPMLRFYCPDCQPGSRIRLLGAFFDACPEVADILETGFKNLFTRDVLSKFFKESATKVASGLAASGLVEEIEISFKRLLAVYVTRIMAKLASKYGLHSLYEILPNARVNDPHNPNALLLNLLSLLPPITMSDLRNLTEQKNEPVEDLDFIVSKAALLSMRSSPPFPLFDLVLEILDEIYVSVANEVTVKLRAARNYHTANFEDTLLQMFQKAVFNHVISNLIAVVEVDDRMRDVFLNLLANRKLGLKGTGDCFLVIDRWVEKLTRGHTESRLLYAFVKLTNQDESGFSRLLSIVTALTDHKVDAKRHELEAKVNRLLDETPLRFVERFESQVVSELMWTLLGDAVPGQRQLRVRWMHLFTRLSLAHTRYSLNSNSPNSHQDTAMQYCASVIRSAADLDQETENKIVPQFLQNAMNAARGEELNLAFVLKNLTSELNVTFLHEEFLFEFGVRASQMLIHLDEHDNLRNDLVLFFNTVDKTIRLSMGQRVFLLENLIGKFIPDISAEAKLSRRRGEAAEQEQRERAERSRDLLWGLIENQLDFNTYVPSFHREATAPPIYLADALFEYILRVSWQLRQNQSTPIEQLLSGLNDVRARDCPRLTRVMQAAHEFVIVRSLAQCIECHVDRRSYIESKRLQLVGDGESAGENRRKHIEESETLQPLINLLNSGREAAAIRKAQITALFIDQKTNQDLSNQDLLMYFLLNARGRSFLADFLASKDADVLGGWIVNWRLIYPKSVDLQRDFDAKVRRTLLSLEDTKAAELWKAEHMKVCPHCGLSIYKILDVTLSFVDNTLMPIKRNDRMASQHRAVGKLFIIVELNRTFRNNRLKPALKLLRC